MNNTLRFQSVIGFMVWLMICFLTESNHQHADWHIRILELAALVWLPLGVQLLEQKAFVNFAKPLINSILATAISLVIALEFAFDYSAFLSIPYVALTMWLAMAGVENWILLPRHLTNLTLSSSLLMLPVASLWAMSHCFDYQPLSFPSEIVTLTAVHFHYAGFLFILASGMIALYHPTKLSFWACRLAIAAVPLTALGITITQLSNNYMVETCAAVCVTLAGFCCALSYIFAFAKQENFGLRISSLLFALVLIFSMSLAFLYAIRPHYPMAWLNIPFMKAFHGTCNGVFMPSLLFSTWKLNFFAK